MKVKFVIASLTMLLSNWAAAAPFNLSADGQEVTDTKTGLIWRRCPENMAASGGACIGTAATFTHVQALQRASAQAAAGWRLPNVKELFSLIDTSRISPKIDVAAFPNTPPNNFWSSTPYVAGFADHAWLVNFSYGAVNMDDRAFKYPVRLVRAGQ